MGFYGTILNGPTSYGTIRYYILLHHLRNAIQQANMGPVYLIVKVMKRH